MQQLQNIQHLLQEAAKREQARQAGELADAQLKIVTAAFDRSVAYSNILFVGGYAGFFGLWQLTKESLAKQQALWSALLVLVSLVFFVLFEVVKMVVTTRAIQRQAAILRSQNARTNPATLLEQLAKFEAIQQRGSQRFMRFWVMSVAVSLSTGLVGAGVLLYAFVAGLRQ